MMSTLPVCSAAACCYSNSQIPIHGGSRSFSSCWKTCEIKCNVVHQVALDLSNSFHSHGASLREQSSSSLYSKFVQTSSLSSSGRNELDGINYELLTNQRYPMGVIRDSRSIGTIDLKFVDNSAVPVGREEVTAFSNDLINNAKVLPESANLESIATGDVIQGSPASALDLLDLDTNSLSDVKSNAMEIFSEVNKSISGSAEKAQSYLDNSLDRINSSVTSALRGATQAVDDVIGKLTSTVDKTGESAGDGVTALSTGLKEASGKAGIIAVDALRHIIIFVEDSSSKGATFVVYAYGSVKEILPPEIQDVLNLSEEQAVKFFTPVGTALQQVYAALAGLERSLGLDPSDPVIPFFLFIGASTSLWAFYWVFTYGGYAGDLSSKSTLELLKGDKNAVLVDIRPEDLREKDGIPDLRRAARFRYANVTLPEVGGSVRKLFRSGRDLDDSLLAAVIRNLKIVQDRSQVILMDADGNRSKSIARSLRRLGVKRPYLVQGGFQSWVKEGLRIKELKPETTFTILNEEAEAIFEEINPTPLQLVGYGVGFVAAAYALVEWEKTLQYAGIFGLGQTVYRRLSSYNDAEDLRQDVRQLLAPVSLGGQAITWAAGKLEINRNRNGLPTSPSSTDVQDRVLQAAAKHESQSDNEETQDPSPETLTSVSENVDLSEA